MINALFMVIAAIGTIVMLNAGFNVADIFLVTAILNSLVAIYIYKLRK